MVTWFIFSPLCVLYCGGQSDVSYRGKSKFHLVTFADGAPFNETQLLLHRTHVSPGGFVDHTMWRGWAQLRAAIKRGVFDEYLEGLGGAETLKKIPPSSLRRGGYWKPLLILHALDSSKLGSDDFVLFHDSSQYVRKGFEFNISLLHEWMQNSRNDLILTGIRLRTAFEYEYTQRCVDYRLNPKLPITRTDFEELLEYLNMCRRPLGRNGEGWEKCSETMWQSAMTQNAYHLWRKVPEVRAVLLEWLRLAVDPYVLRRVPIADQSILGLLTLKYEIPTPALPYHSKMTMMMYPEDPLTVYSNVAKHVNLLIHEIKIGKAHLTDPSFSSLDDMRQRYISPVEWAQMRCVDTKTVRVLQDPCMDIPAQCCELNRWGKREVKPAFERFCFSLGLFNRNSSFPSCCRGVDRCWRMTEFKADSCCDLDLYSNSTGSHFCWEVMKRRLEIKVEDSSSLYFECCRKPAEERRIPEEFSDKSLEGLSDEEAIEKVHLVTFADRPPFTDVQILFNETFKSSGSVLSHSMWSKRKLVKAVEEGDFDRILGGGMSRKSLTSSPFSTRFWKPLVILHTLLTRCSDSSCFVLYHDCSQYTRVGLERNVSELARWMVEEKGVNQIAGIRLRTDIEYEFSQRCHDYRGGREPKVGLGRGAFESLVEHCGLCEEREQQRRNQCMFRLWHSAMTQNSFSLWRWTEDNAGVLLLWMRWTVDRHISQNVPLADQSVLELIIFKFRLGVLALPLHSLDMTLQFPQSAVVAQGNTLKHINQLFHQIDKEARGEAFIGLVDPQQLLPDDVRRRYVSSTEWMGLRCVQPQEANPVERGDCSSVPSQCCEWDRWGRGEQRPPFESVCYESTFFDRNRTFSRCCRGGEHCWAISNFVWDSCCETKLYQNDTGLEGCWAVLTSLAGRKTWVSREVYAQCCERKMRKESIEELLGREVERGGEEEGRS